MNITLNSGRIWPSPCARSATLGLASLAVVGGVILSGQARADLPPLSATAIANGATITQAQGFEFVNIGSPGNAPVPREFQDQLQYRPQLGSVDHAFGMSRTEVTYGQYLPFVQSYVQLYGGESASFTFLGSGIVFRGGNDRDPANYSVAPGLMNSPVGVGWRYAARYCNWLSNGRATTAAAFNTGAYEVSTFYVEGSTTPPHERIERLPGAQFFMPTLSEWTKAFYFDGNRYGPGQPGCWQYPTTSDQSPLLGLPSQGGQTSAGLGFRGIRTPLPVVSYPTVMSPWGLFDGSGGAEEWLEEAPVGDYFNFRYTRGTAQMDGLAVTEDTLSWYFVNHTQSADGFGGIRLATTIPTPSSGALLLVTLLLSHRHRTRQTTSRSARLVPTKPNR